MSATFRQMTLWATGVMLVLVLGVLHIQLDRLQGSRAKLQHLMYLPDGRYLRTASLGYRELVADLLWLQAIQAMGERKVSKEVGSWIYRALDVVTTLDPKFVRAYEAGGIALCTIVVLPEESNRLLEKGILHNPGEWTLPFLLGVNYYFELYDDAKAAEYMAQASRLPGAPDNLGRLAARLFVSAKSPQQAVELLAEVYEQTSDENLRKLLEERLKEAIVERDLQTFEQAIGRYRKLHSRQPDRLEDLVGPGLLRELPREPFGGQYLYDPQTQSVRSSEVKERMRMPGHRRNG